MDPTLIGAVSVGALFFLILIGFHVGVALMAMSAIGVYAITGNPVVAASLLKTTAYSAVGDYIFAVIPLFVLMGLLTTASGATRELFVAAEALLRRVRGGVGIATVAANAVFAAITGVSVASVAVFSKLSVPEMRRLNYDLRFSLGIVASSSLLGMLIPPSILMIVYGIITEQSVGRLFAAGILPGLLVAFGLSATVWCMAKWKPSLAGGSESPEPGPGVRRRDLIARPWPLYALIMLVLGGIYGGFFTPTEAGAVGAFGALLIVFLRGGGSPRAIFHLLLESGRATASIFFLLIAASMYSRMLTLSRLPVAITDWATDLQIGPLFIVAVFILVILLLGMILDSVSILLLTAPIMVPVVISLGFDPIWFGIVAIVAIELGLLTPPFGMAVFSMKAALPFDVRLEEIYLGALPFLLMLVVLLVVLVLVPSITLVLPQLMFG